MTHSRSTLPDDLVNAAHQGLPVVDDYFDPCRGTR